VGGLSRIEWVNQQGKAYGAEATIMILDHAFKKLNLHSVTLQLIDYKEAAVPCMDILADEFLRQRATDEWPAQA